MNVSYDVQKGSFGLAPNIDDSDDAAPGDVHAQVVENCLDARVEIRSFAKLVGLKRDDHQLDERMQRLILVIALFRRAGGAHPLGDVSKFNKRWLTAPILGH